MTAGVFAGAGQLKLASLLSLVTLCAIAGDQLGYLIGWRAGKTLYERNDSRFFKRRHFERAHEFYETYGGRRSYLRASCRLFEHFVRPLRAPRR